MINFKRLIFGFSCMLITGCTKKYVGSIEVCKKTLYVEIYNLGPVDMSSAYLTDSVNFRIWLGKYDPAFEYYDVKHNGDSIYIKEFALRNSLYSLHDYMLEKHWVLNLEALRKQHKWE